MDHAKKYHKEQLANQGAFKRATQEVDDAKIQRFLLEGQESPTLVNATNEVMNIHFVSKRRNATKEKDASSVKGGFKAETSGFGVNGGKATTYPEECDRICTSQKNTKDLSSSCLMTRHCWNTPKNTIAIEEHAEQIHRKAKILLNAGKLEDVEVGNDGVTKVAFAEQVGKELRRCLPSQRPTLSSRTFGTGQTT